jgi:hypothetical protein
MVRDPARAEPFRPDPGTLTSVLIRRARRASSDLAAPDGGSDDSSQVS